MNSVPHRSCTDVDLPIRSELMILMGLMIALMERRTHLKHEIFPVYSFWLPYNSF